MQNQLFADVPEKERKQYLSDNCDRVEEMDYLKRFSPEDLTLRKDQLATVSIEIKGVEEEKKEAVAVFADSLKSLNKKKNKLLTDLHNKAERVTEQCFAFFDQDSRTVGYYNNEGQLISARPMRPEEMQKTVFSVTRGDENRTGTDD